MIYIYVFGNSQYFLDRELEYLKVQIKKKRLFASYLPNMSRAIELL